MPNLQTWQVIQSKSETQLQVEFHQILHWQNKEILIGDGTGFTVASLSGSALMTNAGVVSLTPTQADITTCANLTTTGALNAGSITTNFGTINNGSSAITTTGTITGGQVTVDNFTIANNKN